jgi:hypothetical protein
MTFHKLTSALTVTMRRSPGGTTELSQPVEISQKPRLGVDAAGVVSTADAWVKVLAVARTL